jgi:hypothetical protein
VPGVIGPAWLRCSLGISDVMKPKSFFTAKRLAWLLVVASAACLPLHLVISGRQSNTIAGFAIGVIVMALALALFQPRTDAKRFLPAVCAFLLYLVHALFPSLGA